MAISSRAISDRSISGDADEEPSLPGKFKRRWRTPVLRDRYPGIDAQAPLDAVESEAPPTPIYDALPPDMKAAVDRLIVGYRMSQQRSIA